MHAYRVVVPGLLLVLGCSDSTSSTGGSGGATGVTSTGGAPGTGGGAATGGAPGVGGAGGAGCEEPTCPQVAYVQEALQFCATAGPLALADSGVVECASTCITQPVVMYKITVAVGDCVFLEVDNAGAAALGPTPTGGILDANGRSLEFTTDVACTVDPFAGSCPQGGAVIETAGDAYVTVGMNEFGDCTQPTPYQLTVSINGVDVALTPLCSGDLNDVLGF